MNINNSPKYQSHLWISAFLLSLSCLFGFRPAAEAAPGGNISIIPTITSINLVNGQLVASGTAAATVHGRTTTVPFTAPITLAAQTNQPGTCPVLDLALGPINLDLLGIVVETSPICLNLTALQGGGLLGNLLCSVANLLNGGLSLGQILNGVGLPTLPALTAGQITDLLGGLTTLLNGALENLLDGIVDSITNAVGATCDILHLELGPLDLNLLGLEVSLDDCSGGPVVLDVTGHRGRGNLLGNLLCGLLNSGRIDIGSTLAEILALLHL